MEETQSFRLTGTKEIVKIPIQHVGGQPVIHWESIKQVFPGVKCVKNGDVAVPRCLQYFPGIVLDVVLSNASENVSIDSSVETLSMAATATLNSVLDVGQTNAPADPHMGPSSEDTFIEDLQVTSAIAVKPIGNIGARKSSTGFTISPPSSPNVGTISKTALSFIEALKCSKMSKEFDVQVQQQAPNAKIDDIVRLQEVSNANIAYMIQLQKESAAKQEEMSQLQQEMKQMQEMSDAKQEEMTKLQKQALAQQEKMEQLAIDHHEQIKQLQIQALAQLSVLQDRVQAVLTQTYELHEYPIPRLFVVLPQDPSEWNAKNPFSNKFRLFFLCECGEHTKSIDSNTAIHFAKHEGYEIARPTEFFQLYGSHVFTVLKMLKFGISVAGVAVPAIPHLVRADVIDQVSTYLQLLKEFEPMMNPVIDWMDEVSTNEGESVDEFTKHMKNKEALAGADLRKLDTFLKAKDGDKVLGNLYRTVTDEGHVKWVCIDHYGENYLESTAKDFQRTLDAVGGSFDKSLGRIEVTLRSKVLAEQFFSALGKARSVYELNIVFGWPCTTSDLVQLENALKISTRVSILQLDLQQFQTSKLVSTSSQFGVIFRFSEVPSMKTVHIILPSEYSKHLSFQPKAASHPCKLSFDLTHGSIKKGELGRLAEMLKTNSTVTTLDLYGNSIGDDGAKALAEALKTNSTVATLNLGGNSIEDDGAKAMAEALKTNTALTTLNLESNEIGSDGAKALAEALRTNSTLTTLNFIHNSIGSDGAKALAEALKTNSTVATLNLGDNSIGDDGAKALAEALKTNSTVTTLNLINSSIGDDGAKALAEALKTNSTLTTLNLDWNKFGDDGAKALAEALKTNLTLINRYW